MVFDKLWFLKHQKILLWFCNTPIISLWFRWILRINGNRSAVGDNKIVEIYPNAIRWFFRYKYYKRYGRLAEYKIEFRTHDKFGKRLYYAFKPFWYLMHFWDFIAVPVNPIFDLGFNTLTAYPDPSTGATTADANLQRNSVNETFTTIRSGAGSAADNTTTDNNINAIVATATSNQYSRLERTGWTFDSSSLTGSAIISAAVLSVYGTGKDNLLGSFNSHIVAHTPASNNSYVAADFNIANWGTTSFANIAYASINTAAYNDFTLDANGIANVSLTGISKFGSRDSFDLNNSAPTWSSGLYSYWSGKYADVTGTTQDPKLVVTYTPGFSGGKSYMVRQAINRSNNY